MSINSLLIRAFLAGGTASCVIFAAIALPGEARVTIDNFSFKLPVLTIPAGTIVSWETIHNHLAAPRLRHYNDNSVPAARTG